MQNRLYVGKLSGDVTANKSQELFEEHGFVTDEQVGIDAVQLAFGPIKKAIDEAAVAAAGGQSGNAFRVELAQSGASEAGEPFGVWP